MEKDMDVREMLLAELGDFGIAEDDAPKVPGSHGPMTAGDVQKNIQSALNKAANAAGKGAAGGGAGGETKKPDLPAIAGYKPKKASMTDDLEAHDRQYHHGHYQGTVPCKPRNYWKEAGFDVAGYDLKTSGFKTPKNFNYLGDDEGKEEEEEKDVASSEAPQEADADASDDTSEASESPSPEEAAAEEGGEEPAEEQGGEEVVEIGGAEVKVGPEGAKALEELKKATENPELAAKANEELERLADQLAAESIQRGEVPEGPITDEQYEKLKDSDPVKQFKENLKEFLKEASKTGRNLDFSDWAKGSMEARVLSEAVKELNESGGTKIADRIEEVDAEMPEPDTVEAAEEEVASAKAEPLPKGPAAGPVEMSPATREALKALAERFGRSIDAIKQNLSDKEFDRILKEKIHFNNVRARWAKTDSSVSAERGTLRQSMVDKMESVERKTQRDILIDKIKTLLDNANVPVEQKASLELILIRLENIHETDSSVEKSIDKYRTLSDKYRYNELLRGDSEEEEEEIESHPVHSGSVTSADHKLRETPIDISDVPDIQEREGRFNNPEKITNKISHDLNAQLSKALADVGATISPDDVSVKTLSSRTEFSCKLPDGIALSEDEGKKVIKRALELNFPVEVGDEPGQRKATFQFNPYTQTFKITVENDVKGTVSQKALLSSPEFQEAMRTGEVPVLLGMDESGKPIVEELDDLIQSVIIGMTDSGKSIFMTNIISSLLMQDPYNVQPMLVDMKGVDLSRFDGAQNLKFSTATSPEEVLDLMDYLGKEHELRLKLFKKAGVRNIREYNDKGSKGTLPEGLPKHLPRIPLVVDEFADLTEGPLSKEIMQAFGKFARQARASGINMFLATQKPTADFIPSAVTSQGASRFGLAMNKSESDNAKKFGTPDAITFPAKSGGFQAIIGNKKTIKGQTGFLSPEGYSALINKFKNLPEKVGETPATAEPTPPEPAAKNEREEKWLAQHEADVKKGIPKIVKKDGRSAELLKQHIQNLGMEVEEKDLGDGTVQIMAKEKVAASSGEPALKPESEKTMSDATKFRNSNDIVLATDKRSFLSSRAEEMKRVSEVLKSFYDGKTLNKDKADELIKEKNELFKKIQSKEASPEEKSRYHDINDALNSYRFPVSSKEIEFAKNIIEDKNLVSFGEKGTAVNLDGRIMVAVNIGGMTVPFYISTGKGEKEGVREGRFYPVLGLGESGWVNKTTDEDINSYYGSGLLKAISRALDEKYAGADFSKVPKIEGEDTRPGYDNTAREVINQSFRDAGSKVGSVNTTSAITAQNKQALVNHLRGVSDSINVGSEMPQFKNPTSEGPYDDISASSKYAARNSFADSVPAGTEFKTDRLADKDGDRNKTLVKNQDGTWSVKKADGTPFSDEKFSTKEAMRWLRMSNSFENAVKEYHDKSAPSQSVVAAGAGSGSGASGTGTEGSSGSAETGTGGGQTSGAGTGTENVATITTGEGPAGTDGNAGAVQPEASGAAESQSAGGATATAETPSAEGAEAASEGSGEGAEEQAPQEELSAYEQWEKSFSDDRDGQMAKIDAIEKAAKKELEAKFAQKGIPPALFARQKEWRDLVADMNDQRAEVDARFAAQPEAQEEEQPETSTNEVKPKGGATSTEEAEAALPEKFTEGLSRADADYVNEAFEDYQDAMERITDGRKRGAKKRISADEARKMRQKALEAFNKALGSVGKPAYDPYAANAAATTPPAKPPKPPTTTTPPPDDGTPPPDGGSTPPGGGDTPPDGGSTPPGGGDTPPDGGSTPPGGGDTPPAGGSTPPGGDDTPQAPKPEPTGKSSGGDKKVGAEVMPGAEPEAQEVTPATTPGSNEPAQAPDKPTNSAATQQEQSDQQVPGSAEQQGQSEEVQAPDAQQPAVVGAEPEKERAKGGTAKKKGRSGSKAPDAWNTLSPEDKAAYQKAVTQNAALVALNKELEKAIAEHGAKSPQAKQLRKDRNAAAKAFLKDFIAQRSADKSSEYQPDQSHPTPIGETEGKSSSQGPDSSAAGEAISPEQGPGQPATTSEQPVAPAPEQTPENATAGTPEIQEPTGPLDAKDVPVGPAVNSTDPKEILKSELPPKEFEDYLKAVKESVTLQNKINAKMVRDGDVYSPGQDLQDQLNAANEKAREALLKATKGWTSRQRVEADKKWFTPEKLGILGLDDFKKDFKEAASKDPDIAAIEKTVRAERNKKGGVNREAYKDAIEKRRAALDAFRVKFINEKYFPGEENWGRTESQAQAKAAQQESSEAQETPSEETEQPAVDPSAEAAMKTDKTIQSLEKKLADAVAENGENSAQAKKAKKQLDAKKAEFASKFAEAQSENHGVDDGKKAKESGVAGEASQLDKTKGDVVKSTASSAEQRQTNTTNLNEGDLNEGQSTSGQEADDFKRIQAESRGMSAEERRAYRSGSKTLNDGNGEDATTGVSDKGNVNRSRIARVFRGRIGAANGGTGLDGVKTLTAHNKKTGTSEQFKFGRVDGNTFRDVFEVARNYLQNGELVDLHDSYGDDVKCYLSEDGLNGFAVEPDGNLVSVFSLRKGSLGAMAPEIIKAGATHLDAYDSKNQRLAQIYEKVLGFKPVSVMEYNMDYDHDDIAETHGRPNVVFMMRPQDGKDVEVKRFSKDQYDDAVSHLKTQLGSSETIRDGREAPAQTTTGETDAQPAAVAPTEPVSQGENPDAAENSSGRKPEDAQGSSMSEFLAGLSRDQKLSLLTSSLENNMKKETGREDFKLPKGVAEHFMDAIEGKNAQQLNEILTKKESGPAKAAFEAVTGIKLPESAKEVAKAVKEFCGDNKTEKKPATLAAQPVKQEPVQQTSEEEEQEEAESNQEAESQQDKREKKKSTAMSKKAQAKLEEDRRRAAREAMERSFVEKTQALKDRAKYDDPEIKQFMTDIDNNDKFFTEKEPVVVKAGSKQEDALKEYLKGYGEKFQATKNADGTVSYTVEPTSLYSTSQQVGALQEQDVTPEELGKVLKALKGIAKQDRELSKAIARHKEASEKFGWEDEASVEARRDILRHAAAKQQEYQNEIEDLKIKIDEAKRSQEFGSSKENLQDLKKELAQLTKKSESLTKSTKADEQTAETVEPKKKGRPKKGLPAHLSELEVPGLRAPKETELFKKGPDGKSTFIPKDQLPKSVRDKVEAVKVALNKAYHDKYGNTEQTPDVRNNFVQNFYEANSLGDFLFWQKANMEAKAEAAKQQANQKRQESAPATATQQSVQQTKVPRQTSSEPSISKTAGTARTDGLNSQSAQFGAQNATQVSSPGVATLKALKVPQKSSKESVQALNKALESVNQELEEATRSYYNRGELSLKESRAQAPKFRELAGRMSAINGEIDNLLKSGVFRKGRYGVKELKDIDGHRIGIQVVGYHDADGNFQRVEDEMPETFGGSFTDDEWANIEDMFITTATTPTTEQDEGVVSPAETIFSEAYSEDDFLRDAMGE